VNEQIESLLEEKTAIVEDLWKFGADLKGHTYDTLTNRIEMIDYMLSDEGYFSKS
jgi:uncharacterized protein (UPF0335 family)